MKTIFVVHAALAAIALVWMIVVAVRNHRREQHAAKLLRLHGNVEGPPTLHPVIDGDVCIGSGACVRACPEDRALVIVKGRGHLAQASGCVGHGECLRACPVDAITLVFGSARRGVDLPEVDRRFESSQPGLYIAGELGGMGLIATAVRQGVWNRRKPRRSASSQPSSLRHRPSRRTIAPPAESTAIVASPTSNPPCFRSFIAVREDGRSASRSRGLPATSG